MTVEERFEPTKDSQESGGLAGGIAWTVFARAVGMGTMLVVGVVLTRTLTREEVGVYTLALVITAIINSTTNIGLSRYLVQPENISKTDCSTAFWGDTALGLISGLALAASAPLFANAYDAPSLAPMLMVMAATLPLVGMAKTSRNLAFRSLRFDIASRSELSATLLGAASAVIALVCGLGVWAVIIRECVRRTVALVAIWLAVPFRPQMDFAKDSLKRAFGFASRLLGAELIQQLAAATDQLLVGRSHGPAEVGVYSRGQSLVLMPMQQVTSVVGQVLFPTLSRLKDIRDVAVAYTNALGAMMVFTAPAVALMMLLANDAVVVVLGERWADSALFLQILAPTVIWRSTSELLRSLYNSQGRTDLTLRTSMAGRLVLVVSVGIGSLWGMQAIAVANLIGSLLGTLVEQIAARQLVKISWLAILRAVGPVLGAAALAAALAAGAMMFLPAGWIRLVAIPPLYLATFVLIAHSTSVQGWTTVRSAVIAWYRKRRGSR